MPSKNKARGNRLERQVVNQAKEVGIYAIRAYASNGLSLGEAEDVDVKIGEFKGQCKMRKKIASFMKPPESCDIALIKEDIGYLGQALTNLDGAFCSYIDFNGNSEEWKKDIMKKAEEIQKIQLKLRD